MSVIKRKIHTLFHTERIFTKKIEGSFLYNIMPDKMALDLCFYNRFGRRVNWKNPTTFNEKLQWLKLYNRNPLYTTLVDKYAVKAWVANKIGEESIIPTYGIWDSFDDIDFDKLPNQFVLKTTHSGGSSGVIICRDKTSFNFADAKARLTASLKSNTYLIGREWPYKDVPRHIIAEKYIAPEPSTNDLLDYKLMCFNGKVECCFVCTGRFAEDGLKVTFYDNDWHILPFERSHPRECAPIQKPASYEKMKLAAEKMAENLPFARIDFYEINEQPYFGEITFYPGGGCEAFQPDEWDYKFGAMINLPEVYSK